MLVIDWVILGASCCADCLILHTSNWIKGLFLVTASFAGRVKSRPIATEAYLNRVPAWASTSQPIFTAGYYEQLVFSIVAWPHLSSYNVWYISSEEQVWQLVRTRKWWAKSPHIHYSPRSLATKYCIRCSQQPGGMISDWLLLYYNIQVATLYQVLVHYEFGDIIVMTCCAWDRWAWEKDDATFRFHCSLLADSSLTSWNP